MNKKLRLVFLIIAILFMVALISCNGTVLMLAIPFLIYLGAGIITFPKDIRLDASRAVNSYRCVESTPIAMSIRIQNNGAEISCLKLIEQNYPDGLIPDCKVEQYYSIPSNSEVELNYTFHARRGKYKWQAIKLVVCDPFRLFEKTIELKANAEILVWPNIDNLSNFKYCPKPNIRTAGPYLSGLPGSGIDFWGVRDYVQGDSLRSIYWKKAAKSINQFYTKVYEREEMADVGLLIDARALTNRSHGNKELIEYSIHAAALVAKKLLSVGNRVSLLILNDKLVRVFPGYGKGQLYRIVDQLAACSTGDRVSFETLRHLPVRLFPSRSTIVLFSPLTQKDLSSITRYHSEGYQMLVISPDSALSELSSDMLTTYDSLAIRAAAIEREILLYQIKKAGIQVINWDIRQPMITLLQALQLARVMKK